MGHPAPARLAHTARAADGPARPSAAAASPALDGANLVAAHSELRPVTILFADVRGFTRLAEVLPPEQLVAAINQCFDALDEPIARYGGEVDKFMGDAIMATFGAPAAHDDDPRRAVLAALEMQAVLRRLNRRLRKEIGCELEMRIGINTGVVLAGPIGSRRKQAYTVMGDAVNVAARLEHAAPIGGVLIGEATRAHLGSAFRLRARRSLRIRGKETPVRSFVVLGPAHAAKRARGGQVPYVGRRQELRGLRAAIAPLRDGRQVLVRVVGSLGIGKTRLVQEATDGLSRRGVACTTVSCAPYGQDVPYATLAALLRAVLVRLERRHGPTALTDVVGTAAAQDGLDATLATGIVRDLMSGDAEDANADVQAARHLPAQLRKGLLAHATKVLLRASSRERPHLFVLDDCQWLDSASAAVLTEATHDLATEAIGWLFIGRPDWRVPGEWAAATVIELGALPPAECTLLASALLGGDVSPTSIAFVVERADGNPLLLRELAASAADTDALLGRQPSRAAGAPASESSHLTDRLRSLILARVDALDERSRRVTQVASVLGHVFPAELLRRVLGPGDWSPALEHLTSAGLLDRTSRPRGDGGAATWTWQFRHPLVQETVYLGLLSATRATMHRAAGMAIEQMTNAQVPDRLALLALHFGRSDDRQRAVEYLRAAGDRARSLYLNREAITYYDDALGRLGYEGDDRAQRAAVLAGKAEALAVLSEDAAALDSLQAAIDLSTRPTTRSGLWVRMAEIHRRRGEFAPARDDLAQADAILRGRADVLERARVRIGRAMLAFDGGAFADARRLGHEALELLAGKDAPHEEAAAWRAVGIAAARLADLDAALAALSRARRAAQRADDAMLAAAITNNMGAVLHLQGRYARAREEYAESLSFYERVGAKRQIASLWINLGELAWLNGDGDWEAARSYWTRAERLCEEIGDRRNLAVALSNLGEALVQHGERPAARPYLGRAAELAQELGEQELLRDMRRLLEHP